MVEWIALLAKLNQWFEVAIQAMAVHVGLGMAAIVAVYIFRQPLGEFFGTPHTGQYVIGFAVAHLLDRSRYVPERLILRALRKHNGNQTEAARALNLPLRTLVHKIQTYGIKKKFDR